MITLKKYKPFFTFVIAPIFLAVIGELIIKSSVNKLHFTISIKSLSILFTSPEILIGVGTILLAGCLWLVAMSRYELSFIYPFLCLNYILIIFGSAIFLNETIPPNRYIALIFIMTGLIIISRSPHSEKKETP